MAYDPVNVGASPNDGNGDPLRTAFGKINSGFAELGSAAFAATGDFATSTQGGKADSAIQPGDDADTLGSGDATDGYVLTADGEGGAAWEAPSGGGGGGAEALDELTDVDTQGASDGDVLTLDDGTWVPDTLAAVARSGAYSDLSGTPTLGTAAAANTGDFATAAQGSKADSAVQPGDIADLVEGDGIVKIQKITQAAYDLLDPPDEDVLYVILASS